MELRAPQDSFQFKSSIRGLTDQTHEFSFSRVFDDSTKQKELFDEIMLPFVKDILDGQNGLVFTYGVTNSGKVRSFFLNNSMFADCLCCYYVFDSKYILDVHNSRNSKRWWDFTTCLGCDF